VKQPKAVGIKELKNNLSAHLREVQAGTVVAVTDRSRVVAELRSPAAPASPKGSATIAAAWERDGRLVPPAARKQPLEASPVRLRDGTSHRLLDRDRSDT
jgi:antitoxin (DNA-binding transcriptional repressor) of toxin-antitoxin stability system